MRDNRISAGSGCALFVLWFVAVLVQATIFLGCMAGLAYIAYHFAKACGWV